METRKPCTMQAQVWYRHRDNLDQSIRDYAQVICSVNSLEEVEADVRKLVAQDYNVQKVEVNYLCAPCAGVGAFFLKPKGWRKKAAPPGWMLTRKTCTTCNGTGLGDPVS